METRKAAIMSPLRIPSCSFKMAGISSTIHVLTAGILGTRRALRRFIVAMILKESAIICCAVALLGIGGNETIRTIIIAKIPTLQASMNFNGLAGGIGPGLIAGTMGAIYPAYKAARVNPERALRFR
jgi:putative ABC transport system permease protein